MGKFDGIWICTDLDDTFRRYEESVAINSEAVRYFVQNGGKFSFATGRSAEYLVAQSFFDLINAPSIVYNGACVYDYAAGKSLCTVPVSFTIEEFLENMDGGSYGNSAVYICSEGMELLSGVPGWELAEASYGILQERPLKFVFAFPSEQEALRFQSQAGALPFLRNSYIARSWDVGVEITAGNATKGHALRWTQERMEGIHTSIGVGNYENDVSLLAYADWGVAVENALDCVKQAADQIVMHAEKGAIADLIRQLDSGGLTKIQKASCG